MKGLSAVQRDLNNIDLRLGKLYGLKRLSKADYEHLTSKVQELRTEVDSTEELEGIRLGDPENQTPWTPERKAALESQKKGG